MFGAFSLIFLEHALILSFNNTLPLKISLLEANIFWLFSVKLVLQVGELAGVGSVAMAVYVSNKKQVTCCNLPVTGGKLPVTGDRWHISDDRWQVTHETWHKTHEISFLFLIF